MNLLTVPAAAELLDTSERHVLALKWERKIRPHRTTDRRRPQARDRASQRKHILRPNDWNNSPRTSSANAPNVRTG